MSFPSDAKYYAARSIAALFNFSSFGKGVAIVTGFMGGGIYTLPYITGDITPLSDERKAESGDRQVQILQKQLDETIASETIRLDIKQQLNDIIQQRVSDPDDKALLEKETEMQKNLDHAAAHAEKLSHTFEKTLVHAHDISETDAQMLVGQYRQQYNSTAFSYHYKNNPDVHYSYDMRSLDECQIKHVATISDENVSAVKNCMMENYIAESTAAKVTRAFGIFLIVPMIGLGALGGEMERITRQQAQRRAERRRERQQEKAAKTKTLTFKINDKSR